MKLLTRRDIVSAIITGLMTGFIAWRVLAYLGHSLPLGIDPMVLVFVTPIAWVAGVQLGYALGMLFRPFVQFGRFVATGFTNAAVDFGILYLLIALTGIASGIAYSLFKAISFSIATVHSYGWNKYWTFDAATSSGGRRELASFVGVSVASLLVNVGVASLVVAFRPITFAAQSWAGIGAIAGSAVALLVSFTGFRIFVFGKR